MAKKKSSIFKKILLWLLLIIILGGSVVVYFGYRIIYLPNISLGDKKSEIVFIPTGSNFEDVVRILTDADILKNTESFTHLAELKKYKGNVKPGRYRILANLNNNELINLLRSGLQEPVTVTFTNIRSKEQLISRVCKKTEADSTELRALMNNEKFLKEEIGLSGETILTLFIPNTYQFNWNTSAKQFLERMKTEYKKFWTAERKAKAKQTGLTQTQVSVLASIVQAEQQQFPEERPIIAGLYLNRLRIGMPLQSDPTVIYALCDFSICRVLDEDKTVNSPFNTYLHTGLPPGPIYIPEISSIDAVLNHQKNDYLYMCAKEDFSGKHNFARTLTEHNRNAQRYRNALNKSGIMR
jgi:UPF0755 protein